MIKTYFSACLFLFAFVISSCSAKVEQPTEAASPTIAPILPNTPVKRGNLSLTGKMIYLASTVENKKLLMSIQSLDLASGETTTIFNAPVDSHIFYVAVSPDNKQLIMSYYPPPVDNITIYQALYTMPMDGSAPPQLLFMPPTKEDQYIQVEWSPDGKYIYYTHVNYGIPFVQGQLAPVFSIYRMPFPSGQPELILTTAYWPRISADGNQITYVVIDPSTGLDDLFISNSDGTGAHPVPIDPSLTFNIIDAPSFSTDGQTILFSAPAPHKTYKPNWFEKLSGVTVVSAHGNTPSDLWSIPVSGGTPVQLTDIAISDIFASFSPDNEHIAFFSEGGLFVMKRDGSELTLLVPNPQGISGTVRWLP